MSRQIPPKYNSKEKQLQFVNALVHIHDFSCGCDGPLEHIVTSIFKQEKNLKFTTEEKQLIQKCLSGTVEAGGSVLDEFGDDELAALFTQEDGGEKDTTEDGR